MRVCKCIRNVKLRHFKGKYYKKEKESTLEKTIALETLIKRSHACPKNDEINVVTKRKGVELLLVLCPLRRNLLQRVGSTCVNVTLRRLDENIYCYNVQFVSLASSFPLREDAKNVFNRSCTWCIAVWLRRCAFLISTSIKCTPMNSMQLYP